MNIHVACTLQMLATTTTGGHKWSYKNLRHLEAKKSFWSPASESKNPTTERTRTLNLNPNGQPNRKLLESHLKQSNNTKSLHQGSTVKSGSMKWKRCLQWCSRKRVGYQCTLTTCTPCPSLRAAFSLNSFSVNAACLRALFSVSHWDLTLHCSYLKCLILYSRSQTELISERISDKADLRQPSQLLFFEAYAAGRISNRLGITVQVMTT